MPQRFKGVTNQLIHREYGQRCTYSWAVKLSRELVLKSGRQFMKQAELQSVQNIYCDSGKIYLENYKKVLTVNGFQPALLYTLPPCPALEKIEDAVVYCNYPGVGDRSDHRPSFLALCAHNWLCRYDSERGTPLQRIFLSNTYKFGNISWNTQGYSVVVKSRLNIFKGVTVGLEHVNRVVAALAVLTVCPLQYQAVLYICQQLS